MSHHLSTARGFTLVETLIAILIISFSLVAIIPLLTSTLKGTSTTKDYYIATRLAQEGIEIIKAKRNTNINAALNWKTNILDAPGPSSWEPDSTQIGALSQAGRFPTPTSPLRTICVRTTPAAVEGKYSVDCTSTNSKILPGAFTRVITVTDIGLNAIQVSVRIDWNSGANTYTVNTILYNIS